MPIAGDKDAVGAFPPDGAHRRSAKAFARGPCGGVLITWMPAAVNALSKATVNLASRSRTRNRNESARSSRSNSRFRACWATHAPMG